MKKWKLKEVDQEKLRKILSFLKIDSLFATLLLNRNLETKEEIKEFLTPSFTLIGCPFKEIEKALNLVIKTIEDGRKIIIYGDYDVDGLCGTSLLVLMFRELGVQVGYYVPTREEGYGLNVKAIEKLNFDLLITVDCGIGSVEEIKRAKELGKKVIITDHK